MVGRRDLLRYLKFLDAKAFPDGGVLASELQVVAGYLNGCHPKNIHIHTFAHVYIYIHTCTFIYIHIHMYIYAQAHIHIHRHMHV